MMIANQRRTRGVVGIAAVAARDDIDATLRDKARRLLARCADGDRVDPMAEGTPSTVEAEVKATLGRLSPEAPHP